MTLHTLPTNASGHGLACSAVGALIADALRLAAMTAVSTIEDAPMQITADIDGERRTYCDARSLLDAEMHSAEVIELNALAIQYARSTGLVEAHPDHPTWLRITTRP